MFESELRRKSEIYKADLAIEYQATEAEICVIILVTL